MPEDHGSAKGIALASAGGPLPGPPPQTAWGRENGTKPPGAIEVHTLSRLRERVAR